MNLARISAFVRIAAGAAVIALAAFAGVGEARADAGEEVVVHAPGAADTYRVGPGDKLRVIVYGEDDLGGTFDVDGNGFVSLPLIGQVKVMGMSGPEIERIATAKLSDGYLKEPRVNVEVAQYRPFYVLGEVNKPGAYPYVDGLTVQNAVADAGGYTQKAVESGFYVRHAGEAQEIYVSSDGVTTIRPGDVVRIDSSTFWDALSVLGPLTGFAALAAAFHN